MLHYSNASSIEKNRRYLVIKGGLAWLLWQERGVVNSVVELGSSSVGLVVYRREEGGRNNEYQVNRCISMHDMSRSDARRALTWYEVVLVKGGIIRESIPGVSRFRTDEPEGESCVFGMLEVCGGRTGCVYGFVSSF